MQRRGAIVDDGDCEGANGSVEQELSEALQGVPLTGHVLSPRMGRHRQGDELHVPRPLVFGTSHVTTRSNAATPSQSLATPVAIQCWKQLRPR